MTVKYYTSIDGAVAIDDDFVPVPDAPFTEVTLAQYIQKLAEIDAALGFFGLKVTRSTIRANAVSLQGNTIDEGRSYAVFIEDQPHLDITQIVFDLDGSPHNTEFSAPWDFNSTDVGGEAIKYVFTPGVHEIDAHITYGGGSVITLTATFEVD